MPPLHRYLAREGLTPCKHLNVFAPVTDYANLWDETNAVVDFHSRLRLRILSIDLVFAVAEFGMSRAQLTEKLRR